MSRVLHALVLVSLALALPQGWAVDLGPGFDTANKLYEEGKYGDAAGAYEKLLQSGQASAALYFNLGNAWFKAGQLGRAIAAYRSAQRMDPRDPDLKANLSFARKQVQGLTFSESRLGRWLRDLSLNEWAVIAACTIWIWLLLLILQQWRPALKRSFRAHVLWLGVLSVLLTGCLGFGVYQRQRSRTAVVNLTDAQVRHGPLEESQTAFTAHDGAELQVLDQKGDWLEVRASDGRTGWIAGKEVVICPTR